MGSFTWARFPDALDPIAEEPAPYLKPHLDFDVWINNPQSVDERRRKFIRWMGLAPEEEDLNHIVAHENDENGDVIKEVHGITDSDDGRAMPRTSRSKCKPSLSPLSIPSRNTEDFKLSHLNKELKNTPQVNRKFKDSNYNNINNICYTPRTMDKLKMKLLHKWPSMARMIKSSAEDSNTGVDSSGRVRVRHFRKKLKELSALYAVQEIRAHKGSILTMKFSPNGGYLASGGEDKLLRVWKVIEDERSDVIDVPDEDPSCVYFSVNHLSELGPLMLEKDNKDCRFKGLNKTPDSACVMFPPNVFRIVEEPVHVFEGHSGDILDLSWSRDDCLLSSSVDKTVRLWRVGFDRCLKMFLHTDYVTCIQFNPVNDDNFISGSIDGKIRIWAVNDCQVVDWIETSDIISAVSYRPDGLGGVIGSISGKCQFFSVLDKRFQLETQMCLTSKKRSHCNRITGFQFLPQDPTKVLVTCADSHVRVIDSSNVIMKNKGLGNGGNQISASFTSDGKHIISTSEDSSIQIWNYGVDYDQQKESAFLQPKVNNSFECFHSDSSIAIPWPGWKSSGLHKMISSLPLSISRECLMDVASKGSATWPEEKLLPLQSPKSLMGRSEYKLLRSPWRNSMGPHAWGLVIVAAGWDGRIRSYVNYGLPAPP